MTAFARDGQIGVVPDGPELDLYDQGDRVWWRNHQDREFPATVDHDDRDSVDITLDSGTELMVVNRNDLRAMDSEKPPSVMAWVLVDGYGEGRACVGPFDTYQEAADYDPTSDELDVVEMSRARALTELAEVRAEANRGAVRAER